MPGHAKFRDGLLHSGGPAFRGGNHERESVFGEHLSQRGPHGGKGKRVASESSANAAGVAVFQALGGYDRLGHRSSKSVRGAGNAAGDSFPKNEEVRIEIFRPGVSAWSGADGMSFVDDQQSPVFF